MSTDTLGNRTGGSTIDESKSYKSLNKVRRKPEVKPNDK
jgi:hypothetical protein